MKRLLIAGNIFLGLVVIFLACNPTGPKVKTCDSIVTSSYGGTWEGKIYARFAQAISEAYSKDAGKKYIWNGSRATKDEDALCINFRLSVLKRFIYEIESRACGNRCTDTLGIRFYYAKYPPKDDAAWADASLAGVEQYADRHTLFAVATYWDAVKKKYLDYNPWAGCRKPFDLSNTAKPGLIFFMAGVDEESTDAQNHGGLMPPPAGVGTFPTTE